MISFPHPEAALHLNWSLTTNVNPGRTFTQKQNRLCSGGNPAEGEPFPPPTSPTLVSTTHRKVDLLKNYKSSQGGDGGNPTFYEVCDSFQTWNSNIYVSDQSSAVPVKQVIGSGTLFGSYSPSLSRVPEASLFALDYYFIQDWLTVI